MSRQRRSDLRGEARETGRRGLRLVLALAVAGAAPAAAWCEEPVHGPAAEAVQAAGREEPRAPAATPEGPPPAAKASDDGRRTMGRLPANLGRGGLGVFSLDNVTPFAVGAIVTCAGASFDQQVQSSVADPGNSLGKNLSTAGGLPAAITVAGLFVGGRFAHGTRFRALTYDLLDATLVNAVYTQILKVATQRERPDGSNSQSFPSGHASNAFTFATVVELHYGWKLGAPAYVLASAIAYSRLVQNVHYLSDVLAGATLGFIVGRTVVRVNGKPLDRPAGKQAMWSVSPILARTVRGLGVTVVF